MKTRIILSLLAVLACSITAAAQNYLLSSHILDIDAGQPAPGVTIGLERMEADGSWSTVDEKVTDINGRVKDFLEEDGTDHRGIYRLVYHVKPYFESRGKESFYPFIEVVFEIGDGDHYHVPITLSAFGYSTYRGN